jgi:hypothetical protein
LLGVLGGGIFSSRQSLKNYAYSFPFFVSSSVYTWINYCRFKSIKSMHKIGSRGPCKIYGFEFGYCLRLPRRPVNIFLILGRPFTRFLRQKTTDPLRFEVWW